MGRKKKPGFRNPKMFSSRMELDDYIKLEEAIETDAGKHVKIQDLVTCFARSIISGTIVLSGSLFVGGTPDDEM